MATLRRGMMQRVLTVARWEWLSAVTRPSFIAIALGLPLAQLGLGALLGTAMQAALREEQDPKPVAIVASASGDILPVAGLAEATIDEAEALRALRDGTVSVVVVLDSDYPRTGRVRLYSSGRPGLFAVRDAMQRRERAEAAIRQALASEWTDDVLRDRVLRPIVEVEPYRLGADGRAAPDTGGALAVMGGAFGMALLLCLAIFLASGLLQEAMAVERENRMLELLLVSVRPAELLGGKVLGLGGAGLVQIGVYFALALWLAPAVLGLHDVPASLLLKGAAAFMTGYALFASLMAATGTLGRDPQASAQISTLWLIAGAAPMFLIAFISGNPGSTLSHVLTWVPLTAPVTLLLRLGSGPVGIVEIVGALALTLATAGAVLWLSAAMMRRVALGQPVLHTRR